jgi:hypothetical protein
VSEITCDLAQAVLRDVNEDDARTFGEQAARAFKADAGSGSGNGGNLAGKTLAHGNPRESCGRKDQARP